MPEACSVHVPIAGDEFLVVAVGASAGGLEACTKLLTALPAGSGMAFILVQHLDPTHESLLTELLGSHTSLAVQQAAEGMPIEREHLYIIPPGTYLAVEDGLLHLRPAQPPRGARLPFDVLLHSMAGEYGPRAVCVVLSGTGADGSVGLKAIKQHGGFVIAQDTSEAEYDGMPRCAIATGLVDLVLPVADIPEALAMQGLRTAADPLAEAGAPASPTQDPPDRLPEIIDLLRAGTAHDFAPYKPGTLRRRVERRMAMASMGVDDIDRYVTKLRQDPAELESLAQDWLINVTGFFRDPPVFDLLADKIVPDLLRGRGPDRPLRVWIAGCSTGEEAYSLAMIFHEQITAAKSKITLQVFASDIDADAVAAARDGIYPATIATSMSPSRLASFFIKDGQFYRVSPELRAMVVFTVQDLLTDPPFSRLDLVSCRNLMIYLGSAAQRRVIALFHFALNEGGVLLLGSSEGVGDATSRFEAISEPARLYRHIGRSRPGEVDFSRGASGSARAAALPARGQASQSQAVLAELSRRHAVETHAPASVLSNRQHECLYSLGPTERYLRMAPGIASLDLLAMVRDDVRGKLRLAIERAIQENAPVIVDGGYTIREDRRLPFNIEVHPVLNGGEELLLIYFVDQPGRGSPIDQPGRGSPIDQPGRGSLIHQRGSELPADQSGRKSPVDQSVRKLLIGQPDREPPSDQPGRQARSKIAAEQAKQAPRVLELERELEAARAELHSVTRSLEISGEERKSINEIALSVKEEFQSTNEELLTSKEELQSLNEELTALNSQLQETLEQHRTTSNDMQNVLYSTDVATLFLDSELNIRFFTPAVKALFNVIRTDVGRPLADLHSLAVDGALPADARAVLATLAPIEREINTESRVWCRRVLPYRTHDNAVEGVVITFTDVTERKHAAEALEAAKRDAELANIAKSRFLAAASHDLRQPLQTLSLLQGLLARQVEGTLSEQLVARLDDTLSAITGMLNTLLDINQIEAGVVRAEVVTFRIDDLLGRLQDEFAYHAHAQGLEFRVARCGLHIESDPRLLEQMLRNLISNALKYTRKGRVLLGCRRHGGLLRIEVWDTGVGIPNTELKAIFDEYHQLDNAARERGRGLGLGLSIVQRLATLLGHHVRVRSRPGKGSVFSIEVKRAHPATPRRARSGAAAGQGKIKAPRRTGTVLVVEDDPEVRELLEHLLIEDGYSATSVPDGRAALDLVTRGAIAPDLILADYNLPNGMNGLQVTARLREALHREMPVIILTGDISTGTLAAIAGENCQHLNKPVKLAALTQAIQGLLPQGLLPQGLLRQGLLPGPQHGGNHAAVPPPTGILPDDVISIVDDDGNIRALVRALLEDDGRTVRDYATGEAFLSTHRPGHGGCLLVDANLPGMGGLELLQRLRAAGDPLPAIMITGDSDVPMAVEAMKAGAADFIEKPIAAPELLASIDRALERSRDSSKALAWRESATRHIVRLTARERQVMDLVLAGHPSKNIAADLGLSQRTVENHRASVMKKTGATSLPALARLALAAAGAGER